MSGDYGRSLFTDDVGNRWLQVVGTVCGTRFANQRGNFGVSWDDFPGQEKLLGEKALKTEIEQVTNKSPNARPEAWFAKVLESASIDWEKIGASTKIPFFSPDNYWWFGLKNEKSIRKHCSPKRVASWYSRKDEPDAYPHGALF